LGLMRHEDGWHLLNLCGKWPFATTQHNPTFLVERVLRIYSKFILGALSVAHDMTDNPGNNPGD